MQSTCKERMVAHVIGVQELPHAQVQEGRSKRGREGGKDPAPPPVLISLQDGEEALVAGTLEEIADPSCGLCSARTASASKAATSISCLSSLMGSSSPSISSTARLRCLIVLKSPLAGVFAKHMPVAI